VAVAGLQVEAVARLPSVIKEEERNLKSFDNGDGSPGHPGEETKEREPQPARPVANSMVVPQLVGLPQGQFPMESSSLNL